MNFNPKTCWIAVMLQVVTANIVLAEEPLSSFTPKKIISAENHTCLLSTSGKVKCWGFNNYGGLGIESNMQVGQLPDSMGAKLPTVDLGKDVVVKDMCAGWSFSCAVTTTGRVKCWGLNNEGQLGQEVETATVGAKKNEMGDNLPWTNLGTDFVANDVQCGNFFACAINTKGQVKCWGDNVRAELGRTFPGRFKLGNKVGDMGDNLPYLTLPPVKTVSLGTSYSCAASSDAVYCWGGNYRGEGGIESSAIQLELPANPKDARKVKLEDGGVPTKIHSLMSGGEHTCAEYSSGMPVAKRKIKCWGLNTNGQLGIGSTKDVVGKEAGTMGSRLPVLQLNSSDFIQMETYATSSCALKRNGVVQCWGGNDHGQLGLGDTLSRGRSAEDLGSQLKNVDLGLPVLALSHGSRSTSVCALLINHEVKCWGDGNFGQLGYEDNISRGDVASDMGDNLPFVSYK